MMRETLILFRIPLPGWFGEQAFLLVTGPKSVGRLESVVLSPSSSRVSRIPTQCTGVRKPLIVLTFLIARLNAHTDTELTRRLNVPQVSFPMYSQTNLPRITSTSLSTFQIPSTRNPPT